MQWPQLVIRDGILKWRFESVDGLSVCWQVVWPASLRSEFLSIVHGGVTGGHFGRKNAQRQPSNLEYTGHHGYLILTHFSRHARLVHAIIVALFLAVPDSSYLQLVNPGRGFQLILLVRTRVRQIISNIYLPV